MGTKVTSAAEVHDSEVFEELLDENNSNGSAWADSAYHSHIHRKSTRKRPSNEREQEANRKRSKVRTRVEHVLAQQANRSVRSIMMNLVYKVNYFCPLLNQYTKTE
ncbi:hypothetical protein [Candidatus Vondammii sp. HM_W22]|uniref:hypothetical protein n=1 Tax=Candidatus Vondammii sp. HM_W22 TaxID=2687299 RepID=UPI001F132D3C|nr:hypothetical protein [Candidatus Vondammii sp. HM_W22]